VRRQATAHAKDDANASDRADDDADHGDRDDADERREHAIDDAHNRDGEHADERRYDADDSHIEHADDDGHGAHDDDDAGDVRRIDEIVAEEKEVAGSGWAPTLDARRSVTRSSGSTRSRGG
jgi:GAF domain-containing protein